MLFSKMEVEHEFSCLVGNLRCSYLLYIGSRLKRTSLWSALIWLTHNVTEFKTQTKAFSYHKKNQQPEILSYFRDFLVI